MELNHYRHFYLYAKGLYKKGDVIDDLIILTREYSGTSSNMRDSLFVLSQAVEQYIFEYSGNARVLSARLGEYTLRYGLEEDNAAAAWVKAHLLTLSLAKLRDDKGKTILNLGQASSNILPLTTFK